MQDLPRVAPFTGAWIEIRLTLRPATLTPRSLPSRERGLKFRIGAAGTVPPGVAPFTGAWIEIGYDTHSAYP